MLPQDQGPGGSLLQGLEYLKNQGAQAQGMTPPDRDPWPLIRSLKGNRWGWYKDFGPTMGYQYTEDPAVADPARHPPTSQKDFINSSVRNFLGSPGASPEDKARVLAQSMQTFQDEERYAREADLENRKIDIVDPRAKATRLLNQTPDQVLPEDIDATFGTGFHAQVVDPNNYTAEQIAAGMRARGVPPTDPRALKVRAIVRMNRPKEVAAFDRGSQPGWAPYNPFTGSYNTAQSNVRDYFATPTGPNDPYPDLGGQNAGQVVNQARQNLRIGVQTPEEKRKAQSSGVRRLDDTFMNLFNRRRRNP